MKELIALFRNQKTAEQAVNGLTEAVLGDHDIRVTGKWSEDLDSRLDILPISNPTSGISGVVGPRASVGTAALNTENEVIGFFKQSLQKGGVLVVVRLAEDEYVGRAESILQEQEAVAVAVAAN